MLHANFQDYRTPGSGEDFLNIFTIYGHGPDSGELNRGDVLRLNIN